MKFCGAFETQMGKMVSGNMNEFCFFFKTLLIDFVLGAMK